MARGSKCIYCVLSAIISILSVGIIISIIMAFSWSDKQIETDSTEMNISASVDSLSSIIDRNLETIKTELSKEIVVKTFVNVKYKPE